MHRTSSLVWIKLNCSCPFCEVQTFFCAFLNCQFTCLLYLVTVWYSTWTAKNKTFLLVPVGFYIPNGYLQYLLILKIILCSDAASGWAGWALAHLEFGSSINPITTWGTNYAHQITASPPRFENPALSLLCTSKVVLFDQCLHFSKVFFDQ